MTRAQLRKVLNTAGVPTGRATDGHVATIVEYVDVWGVMPGATPETSTESVKAALDAAGVSYRTGNMPMVNK